MKAICVKRDRELEVRDIPTPEAPADKHVIVKMDACAINHGDITFLKRLPPLTTQSRQHDVWGVSGTGTIMNIGADVPKHYAGRKVSVYRSLVTTPDIIGTWCEYAQLHFLNCILIPAGIDADDYCGSLVNVITPFAFWKQAVSEGHKGVLITAGTSATGIAMLGVGIALGVPMISIVRNQAGRNELLELGAKNVLVQESPDFSTELAKMTEQLETTAVFDGIGGEIINQTAPLLPRRSTIYSYGFLGKESNFNVSAELFMMKSLTIKSFGNFMSPTVQNHESLEAALTYLAEIIAMPHFKTNRGKVFCFDQIDDALKHVGAGGEKRILVPGTAKEVCLATK